MLHCETRAGNLWDKKAPRSCRTCNACTASQSKASWGDITLYSTGDLHCRTKVDHCAWLVANVWRKAVCPIICVESRQLYRQRLYENHRCLWRTSRLSAAACISRGFWQHVCFFLIRACIYVGKRLHYLVWHFYWFLVAHIIHRDEQEIAEFPEIIKSWSWYDHESHCHASVPLRLFRVMVHVYRIHGHKDLHITGYSPVASTAHLQPFPSCVCS